MRTQSSLEHSDPSGEIVGGNGRSWRAAGVASCRARFAPRQVWPLRRWRRMPRALPGLTPHRFAKTGLSGRKVCLDPDAWWRSSRMRWSPASHASRGGIQLYGSRRGVLSVKGQPDRALKAGDGCADSARGAAQRPQWTGKIAGCRHLHRREGQATGLAGAGIGGWRDTLPGRPGQGAGASTSSTRWGGCCSCRDKRAARCRPALRMGLVRMTAL